MFNKFIMVEDRLLCAYSTETKAATTGFDISIFETSKKALESGNILVRLAQPVFVFNETNDVYMLYDLHVAPDPEHCISITNKEMMTSSFDTLFGNLSDLFSNSQEETAIFKKLNECMNYYSNWFRGERIPKVFGQLYGCSIASNDPDRLDSTDLVYESNEGTRIVEPTGPIFIPFIKTSDVIRAFNEELTETDFMLDKTVLQTSEFLNEEDSDDITDAIKLYPSDVIPMFDSYIEFKEKLAKAYCPDNMKLFKSSVDSVYYKQNIKTLGIQWNEELESLLIGKSKSEPEVQANELELFEKLSYLYYDIMMYENKVYNIIDKNNLHPKRSKIGDSFLEEVIRLIICLNYAYCGKASKPEQDVGVEDEDSAVSLRILGYQKLKYVNGLYSLEMSEEDYILNKQNITGDGHQLVSRYLQQIVCTEAYVHAVVQLLRFEDTKCKFLEVKSESDVERPYFDTETFSMVTDISTQAPYKNCEYPEGYKYKILCEVICDADINKNGVEKLTMPVGVVLTSMQSNGIDTRDILTFIDSRSFYMMSTLKTRDGKPLLDVRGIHLTHPTAKPFIDIDELDSTMAETMSVSETYSAFISSDIDLVNVNTLPEIIDLIYSACVDVGLQPDTNYLLNALAKLDMGTYSVDDILNGEFSTKDKTAYVEKTILNNVLKDLIQKSKGTAGRFMGCVEYLNKLFEVKFNSDTKVDAFVEEISSNVERYVQLVDANKVKRGYIFRKQTGQERKMFITSIEDIGLDVPTPEKWNYLEIEKLPADWFNNSHDEETYKEYSNKVLEPNKVFFKSYKSFEEIKRYK